MFHAISKVSLIGLITAVAWLGFTPLAVFAGPITEPGRMLAKALNDINVGHLWLANRRVHWKTGEPYGPPPNDGQAHTHCSAFVAAFCERCGVYILRPPEHPTTMLANAQADWLRKEGKKTGWTPVADSVEAQQLANQGVIVVAVYKERNPKRHGHIALVRPSNKSKAAIRAEGPQITQAGMDNYQSASLREGFKHHRTAWARQEIRYYSHTLKLSQE